MAGGGGGDGMTDTLARLTAALADKYRIEREIGAGGMATVYLAEDLRHGRQVALKVLRPELAATLGSERFFREIQVAARLQHPHILPLHDSGEAGGFLYFVMPYVEGESLRERLARVGELPVHDAVKILVEVVDALACAHSQGVVHRDIKPDNVMLSGRHALVTDFGVAKAVSEATGRQQLTTAGVALGTPSYMAPEQAAADPHLDHRVDIYAVGAMAYELLTGRPPFTGMTSQQILAAHVTQAPDPVSRHRPTCPPALEAVILRCLAKRAADRFQTAEELLQNLEPLATPSGGMTPTQTRPITGWQPAAASRRWMPMAVVGVVMLAALGWIAFRGRGAAPAVQLERVQLTFTGNASSPGISQDGSRIAYSTRQCDTAGLCTLDIVIQDVGGAGLATVLRGALGIWEIKWTADGRYLVYGASSGADKWGAWSVPTLGGDPRYLGCCDASIIGTSDTALVSRPALVGDSIGWLRWVTIADGVVRDSLAIHTDGSGAGLFAESFPGGQRLLIAHRRNRSGTAVVASRTGVALDSIVFTLPQVPTAVTVAPDGQSLVVLMPRPQVQGEVDVLRYQVSGKGRITTTPDTVVRQLTINAGGDLSRSGTLGYGFGPTEYSVWALRRDNPTSMHFSQRRLASSTALLGGSLSPTGDRVLFNRPATSGDERRQLSVMPFDSGPESPLGPPMDLVDWDWTQDGKGVTLVAPRGRDSLTISRMDVPSARTTQVGVMARADYVVMETVAGGGEILIPTPQSFRRFDIPGLADSAFQLPDALGSVVSIDPSPDGKAFVAISWDPNGDSLLVHRVSIGDGSVTRLAAFGGEGSQPPKWFDDGSIVIPILETSSTLAWYRIPPGGGKPVRMGTPPRYPAQYRFSGDGLRVMARAQDRRTDIYLVPNFGEVLKWSPARVRR